MSGLKYVCISDLHLGAAYSVLTRMDEAGKIDLRLPSETLEALGRALRLQVAALRGDEPPTLILLGDILDLGLSATGAVAQAFRRFIEALFPADAPPMFAPDLLCVPGNHDHHLWRTAQDQYFLGRLPDYAKRPFIPDLLQHTQLFDPHDVPCGLMTEMLHTYEHLKDTTVSVAYPNLGLRNASQSRCILLHHGHYLDAIYRAMSTMNRELGGRTDRPKTVAQIERENGAWVDFLWSGLGGSGAVAKDAGTLYRATRSARKSHEFAQRLSDWVLAHLARELGAGPNTELTHGITLSNVVRGLVDLNLLRCTESERHSYDSVMTAEGIADLRWYLEGPLYQELPPCMRDARNCETSFVFGHTHKPFQDEIEVAHYAQPVAVYNTGGWVMDQPTMAPTQGAAVVFIDEELNLGSLRLFNDPLNGTCSPVRVAGTGGYRDAGNPLLARMQTALQTNASAWQDFSTRASAALALHARLLLQETPASEDAA